MKSKELKIYNVPINFKPTFVIDAKPYVFLIALALIGGGICMIDNYQIYGVAILILALSFLMFLPRLIMVEFYKNYLILHNKADKTDCVLIYYEDIVTWYYQRGNKKDYLYIELIDGTSEKIEAFSKTEFELGMNYFLKDKKKKNVK